VRPARAGGSPSWSGAAERSRRWPVVGIAEQAGATPNRMSAASNSGWPSRGPLARDVDVVLADEPTAALDQATGAQ